MEVREVLVRVEAPLAEVGDLHVRGERRGEAQLGDGGPHEAVAAAGGLDDSKSPQVFSAVGRPAQCEDREACGDEPDGEGLDGVEQD